MEILLATSNLHKIREFKDIFKAVKGISLLTLSQFPSYIPPVESGVTFAENALIKASYAAKTLHLMTLADDSGLVVPALEGAPGVHSHRFAGDQATDKDNRRKLLSLMLKLDDVDRFAYFECALALCSPDKHIKTVTAKIEGYILPQERGNNGFGYDPLFIKHDYEKSLAELDESTKNRISHRHKAVEKMRPVLESL